MKPTKRIRAVSLSLPIIAALLLHGLLPAAGSSAQALQLNWRDKVDAGVLAAAAGGKTEFFVYLTRQADLSGAAALPTKEEKGRFVYERLTATAGETQGPVVRALQFVTVPGGAVTGNTKALRVFTLAQPVSTGALRVLVHAGREFSRVVELEAYGPQGQ